MRMGKYLALSRAMLQVPPANLTGEEVDDITAHSGRRVLPGLADAAGYSTVERLALGAWQD
eukprot:6506839-Heterocapsa_arctica.AAC.1